MSIRSSLGRVLASLVLSAAVVAAAAGRAPAEPPCDPSGSDTTAVDEARTTVESACGCATVPNPTTWRRCAHDTLVPLVDGGLSAACRRFVERIERRSTCGRPERTVCCRTNSAGRTTATLRRPGHCSAQPEGAACESALPFLDDGCTASGCATPTVCGDFVVEPGESCDPPDGSSCDSRCRLCLPDGCVAPSLCGNGTVDAGEACDPPNGTTCSSSCTSCAPPAPGEILLGCTSGATGVDASAVAGALLVAYTDATPGFVNHAVAKRLANDGAVVDATPLALSGLLPGTTATGGFTQAATADGSGFYVGWSTFASFTNYFGARRIPASGPLTSGPELIASDFPFGSCRASMSGPLNLAPQLAAGSFRSTWRIVYSCMGNVLFETLVGVGNFFSVPPPGNTSSGPAPIVRGAHDVAAVWWNIAITSISPPTFVQFLAGSWVEPGTPTMIQLSSGFSAVAPALAAIGDTFVAVWANGSELRAMRFTRAAGPLDPDGGILVASGAGAIDLVAAAADGATAIAAWRESTGPGQSAIRAIRIAADGTLPNPTPVAVASSSADAAVGVAANASAALVAFTRAETAGHSVRAVLLGD